MNNNQVKGIHEFQLSVDFFDKPEICAVTVDHGIKGQAATIMLLCAIYRNGYYFEWTPNNYISILKELPGITINKMQRIVKTLVEWRFFDRTLFEQHQVLTSREIQHHYLNTALEGNLSADIVLPYWLTDENENENDFDESPKEETKDDDCYHNQVNTRECAKELMNDQEWIEEACEKNNIDWTTLNEWMESFVSGCEKVGLNEFYDSEYMLNLFYYWIQTGKIPGLETP